MMQLTKCIPYTGSRARVTPLNLLFSQSIPAYTELQYDYNWRACNIGANKPCCCGDNGVQGQSVLRQLNVWVQTVLLVRLATDHQT